MKKKYESPTITAIDLPSRPFLLAGSNFRMLKSNSDGSVQIDWDTAVEWGIITDAV